MLSREGKGPPVVWLGGFKSDMRATKATALDEWAEANGRAFLRFDYSGHGESGGAFEDGTISRWLEDALAVIERFVQERPILVGSSMGGWIALLAARRSLRDAARHRAGRDRPHRPAVDFTERLMWERFPEEHAAQPSQETGVYHRPSAYSDEPYPITWTLIEDGRRHLLFGAADRDRLPGPHPAGHAGSRRALEPCAAACRAPAGRQRLAHPDQGRRPPPLPAGGLERLIAASRRPVAWQEK